MQDQTRDVIEIIDFNGSEIATVEGIRMRIYQERLVRAEHHTALPERQIPPE